MVAPALTLSNQEKQLLELAALKIVESLNVVGSCNVQFALGRNLDYYVIEVNPRQPFFSFSVKSNGISDRQSRS